jgi:excisionase family DNA binding protein
MPRQSVYEMTRKRGQVRHANPLPVCRIGGHIRFRRADIEQWLASSVQKGRKQ